MLTVTDRTELARGFHPQSLPAQGRRHSFYVIQQSLSTKLPPQAWCATALFCVTECLPDDVITDKAETLTRVYLMTRLMPDVPAATRNLKYMAQGFDTELSLIFFDENILHFRRFAKYVATFWRMASSSSRSAVSIPAKRTIHF